MKSHTPRRGFTLLQAVVVLGILVILALIVYPVFNRARDYDGHPSCQSYLKQIDLAFKQYIQDYDEKYPLIAVNAKVVPFADGGVSAFGWADALLPYLKSTQIFQCPTETTAHNPDPTTMGYTDYWFNARMAGKSEQALDAEALTVIMGDGDSSNARYHLWATPQNWMDNANSPLYRHLDGANFAFVDGHTKWVKADRWNNSMDSTAGYTFRLQPVIKAVRK